MSFEEIINGSLLYTLVSVVILFVFVLAFLFAVKAWKRAIELGYTKDKLMKVISSTLVATIVPSLAIVIGLFTLAASLGNPWPWLRLSVIGSVTYELMAADMASSSMGFSSLVDLSGGGIAPFINVMFVMTAGISSGMFVLLFFGKKIQTKVSDLGKNPRSFGFVALECFMIALLATFLPSFFVDGWVVVFTFFTSTLITISLGLIVMKFKIAWLKDFILAFALVGGMASSLLWSGIFGG